MPFTVTDEPLTLTIALEASGPEEVVSEEDGASAPEEVVPEEVVPAADAAEEGTTSSVSPEGEPASPEGEASETAQPFDQSMIVSGVVVTVKAEAGVFPANAALSVKRVPVYRQRQADAAIEDVRDEDRNVAVSYAFDIKVIDPETREELQPAEGQTVSVSFALAEVADENLTTSVYHIDESGEAEKLDVVQEDEDTATVETDGFSLYTVEFTYNTLQYVLPGNTPVLLSEILTALQLTGEVEAATVSDPELVSVSNTTGAWVVTPLHPFTTEEWMKVTINGVVFEITLTDDTGDSGYYIWGEMTDHAVNPAYKLTETETNGVYKRAGLTFMKADNFKVVYSPDGSSTPDFYPNTPDNYSITANGTYDVYFRPDGQGGEGWFGGCIMVTAHTDGPSPTDGPGPTDGHSTYHKVTIDDNITGGTVKANFTGRKWASPSP